MRKLILYISCSLDGYIAKPNDDLSFLSLVQKEGEDYGYGEFITTIDTVIVGRKTYDWVLNQGYDFPHADKESYVITRQVIEKKGNITFYNKDINELVNNLRNKNGLNIFCDGGAEIVFELLKEKQFDELILSIVPILVGNGTRLFKGSIEDQELSLISSKSFDTGLVQLHYKINKA